VRAERPAQLRRERSAESRPPDDELYASFVRATTGEEASPGLVQLFRDTMEEVADATA
jgi:hypothetical protein